MAWVADASLAAAVSEAGGLGLISSINAGTEAVRNEIRKCRELTNKPFGVNIMLQAPNAGEIASMVVEEGVKILTTGAGSPAQYMDMWKEAGIKVIPVVASVALALKMQAIGATAVVAEGADALGSYKFFGADIQHFFALFEVQGGEIKRNGKNLIRPDAPIHHGAVHIVKQVAVFVQENFFERLADFFGFMLILLRFLPVLFASCLC